MKPFMAAPLATRLLYNHLLFSATLADLFPDPGLPWPSPNRLLVFSGVPNVPTLDLPKLLDRLRPKLAR